MIIVVLFLMSHSNFSRSVRAQLEGNGKGGPELANMGNQLAVGEYPSFESHPLHYSTPLAHCSTECYPLSPQPVNGKACTQTHVQYREAQAQHSRVGPWWVLVWASYCPAVLLPKDFIFIVLLSLPLLLLSILACTIFKSSHASDGLWKSLKSS